MKITQKNLFALICLASVSLAPLAEATSSNVVISQVYGGGGNTGATHKNDFIELFNRGSTSVNLNGWSVQYGSSTGTTWTNVTPLGNITLAPGQYYLVQEAAGAGAGVSLPTPDATGTIAMAATAGKVALVNSTVALTGACPSAVDLVGYGGANCFEGTATPALTNSTAAIRNNAGCDETDSNSVDFTTSTPNPRNTATALHVCGGTSTTPIYSIQGSGAKSLMVGQTVTTSGVVTKLSNNGFYLQDPLGDGFPLTSDGIFVFTSTAPTVLVGQFIQLTATVAEFNTGAASNTDTLAHTVTELTGPTGIAVLSSGNSITPVVVTLPEAINDDLERYEGMLVTLNGPLTASQNYFQGRYGQVTLSANGRMETPTNKYRPNSTQAVALADQNARSRIILDDGTSQQNPDPTPYIGLDNTLRAGDTVSSITGVIDYGLATSSNAEFGDNKIHPTQAVSFVRANPRPTVPDVVGGNIKVASTNVLNFFTTFTNGNTVFGQTGQGCTLDGASSAANCRGADSLAEFIRQRDKIVTAISSMNADVVGLMEIQNNGNTTVQYLVDSLNLVMGAGTYASVALPSQGTGTDAIRVAMIYKPNTVTLVGSAISDTDAINNRPTLLQKFAALNGQQFTVVVNHFKSKGSCPNAGTDAANEESTDGQGCWNGRRILQAQRLRSWLTANAANDALIIGDLNSYAQEDPIFDLTSNGFVDQVAAFNSFGYSYVFDGGAGRLDHAITTASLSAQVTGVKEWHINADEPSIIDYNLEFKKPACATCGPDYFVANQFRASDHDPVLIGLNFNDQDGDGLADDLEISTGTNPQSLDSDNDGIRDGVEDANHNGIVDAGETDPRTADTDGDGIQDGTELGYTNGVADPDGAGPLLGTNLAIFIPDADPSSHTNPNQSDSDNDGAVDGIEDTNHNGRVDAGEYDPLNPASSPTATAPTQVPASPMWALILSAGLLVFLQTKVVGRRSIK